MEDGLGGSEERATRVVVVGAGPAGALFVHALLTSAEKTGRTFRVALHDAREAKCAAPDDPNRAFNVVLYERGLAAVEAAAPGTRDALEAAGLSFEGGALPLLIHDAKGNARELTQPRGRSGKAVLVPRAALWATLVDELDKRHKGDGSLGCTIKFGSRCVSVDLATRVATFADVATGAIYREPYDVIVGADGARSVVRSAILASGAGPPPDFEQTKLLTEWKSIHVQVDEGDAFDLGVLHVGSWVAPRWGGGPLATAVRKLVVGGDVTVLATPTGKARVMNVIVVHKRHDPSPELLDGSEDVTLAFIKEAFPWLPSPEEVARKLCAAKAYTTTAVTLSSYADLPGRAVLVGDAAHATSPALGHGANCALEDAVALASQISSLPDPFDVPKALEAYSAERVPEGNALVALSSAASAISGTAPGWLAAADRIRSYALDRLNKAGVLLGGVLPGGSVVAQLRDGKPYSEVLKDHRGWTALARAALTWSRT